MRPVMNECATRMFRAALLMFCASPQTAARESCLLLRVVLGEAPGAAGGYARGSHVDKANDDESPAAADPCCLVEQLAAMGCEIANADI